MYIGILPIPAPSGVHECQEPMHHPTPAPPSLQRESEGHFLSVFIHHPTCPSLAPNASQRGISSMPAPTSALPPPVLQSRPKSHSRRRVTHAWEPFSSAEKGSHAQSSITGSRSHWLPAPTTPLPPPSLEKCEMEGLFALIQVPTTHGDNEMAQTTVIRHLGNKYIFFLFLFFYY